MNAPEAPLKLARGVFPARYARTGGGKGGGDGRKAF